MAGRIRIEPYTPLDVRTPAVPGGGYIRVDASAASPGKFGPPPLMKEVQELAQGLLSLAQVLSDQLARDNEAAVKDADARLGESEQALLFDPQNGYFNTHGETALTKAPEVLDAYTKAQEREVEALPNDAQRQMLEELAQRRLMTFGEQVERHSVAERQRWYDEAGDQRIAQMRTDAGFYWSDDALLRRALGTTRAEVRDKAERHGWDSPLTEAALRQQTSRTLVSAIEAAVERDPGRAQALRTRYDHHIEAPDRVALDALLSEAQTRQRAQAASAEILTATPPDGEPATPQWRLRQAEAITDPDVRAATIRRVRGAAAAAEARARTLGEQVLARVLKDHLTDPSQIPVREWVALDAKHRQAIETRVDHNARGTEPAQNPALVDALTNEMTQAPSTFARRDLVPAVAHLPLPHWQRFRDWQVGIQRNDSTTQDELYAIKRGMQLAAKMLPPDTTDDSATNYRAELVEEIDTWRRVTGKSPDDTDIAGMLERHVLGDAYTPRTLGWDPRDRPEIVPVRFAFPRPDQGERPGIHRVQDATRAMAPSAATLAQMRALMVLTQRAVIAAQRALVVAKARVAAARAAAQAIPAADVAAASAAAQALMEAMKALEATAREHAAAVEFDEYIREQMRAWSYPYAGQRFTRILEKNEIAEAAALGFEPTGDASIDAQGRQVFVNPRIGEYIVRAEDVRTPGVWEHFDELGGRLGFADRDLQQIYPDPPLNPDFPPHAMTMTPAEKKWRDRMREWERLDKQLQAQGVPADERPPPPEKPPEDEPPPEKPPPDNEEKPDGKPRKERVARPGLSGKEGADDPPSYAKGVPRYVDEKLDDYVARIMEKQFGKDWKQLHPDTGPGSKFSQIRKYGARHWMIPKGGE